MSTLSSDGREAMQVEQAPAGGVLWRVGTGAAGVAVIANLVLLGASGAGGVDHVVGLQPGAPPTMVGAANVVMITAVAMAVGFGLTHLARRRWSPGMRVMQIVGGVFAVASVAMPLGAAEATTGTRLSLAAVHLIVGAVFVVALARLRRS